MIANPARQADHRIEFASRQLGTSARGAKEHRRSPIGARLDWGCGGESASLDGSRSATADPSSPRPIRARPPFTARKPAPRRRQIAVYSLIQPH